MSVTPSTNTPNSNANLAAALAAPRDYLGDAEKNNASQSRQVLHHFISYVAQQEGLQQTEQSNAPAIPDPPGTAVGDLKQGLSVFTKTGGIDVAYIVALVLQLTNQESQELAQEQELQVTANQLVYNAGVAAADSAQAAAQASAAASFVGAGFSILSVGLEAGGAIFGARAGSAAAGKVGAEGAEAASAEGLQKTSSGKVGDSGASEINETTGENIELETFRSSEDSGSSPSRSQREIRTVETEDRATVATENTNTREASSVGDRTRSNSVRSLETQRENVEQEVSFTENQEDAASTGNTPRSRSVGTIETNVFSENQETIERSETPSSTNRTSGVSENERSLNLSQPEEPISATGNTRVNTPSEAPQSNRTSELSDNEKPLNSPLGEDQNTSPRNTRATSPSEASQTNRTAGVSQRDSFENVSPDEAPLAASTREDPTKAPPATNRPSDPETNQRVGDSQSNRSTQRDQNTKSRPPSEVEKLAKELRSALKLDKGNPELEKVKAYEKAYDKVAQTWQIGSRLASAGAQGSQGIGGYLQGNAIHAQLIAQAQIQLQSATSQAAGQTIQQLQELLNNARSIVNGLLQSEFSVSRSA